MRTLAARAMTALLALAATLPPTLVMGAAPLAAQDLQRPDGWKTRFDREGSTEADMGLFVSMPPGWHVTKGPSGIFFGGRDLEGEGQSHTYFLVRDGGEFIVKRREGAETPTLVAWTTHPAVLGYADRGNDASVGNVLTVDARAKHAPNLHVSRLEVTPAG